MGEILIEPLARGFSLEGLKKFLSHKNFTEKEEEISIDLSGDLNDSVLSIKYVANKGLKT